jgi:hypothetical protein
MLFVLHAPEKSPKCDLKTILSCKTRDFRDLMRQPWYWEVGKYEWEPASIIWESLDTFTEQCSGRYSDAFAICMVEGEFLEMDGFDLAPIKITRKGVAS